MPGHPTLYLRKEVYDSYGYYRTDYRISGDYEFMVRILYKDKVKLSYIPEVLVYMSHGGTSTNSLGACGIHVGRTPGIEGKGWAFCMVYGSLQSIPGAVSVCDRPRRVTNKSKCGMLKRSMISGELFL